MVPKKIIYLYTSDRPAGDNSKSGLDLSIVSTNKFAVEAHSDGMIALWDKVATLKGYTVYVIIDSNNGYGYRHISPTTTTYVVSNIKFILDYISPGDIVIVRGGFKPWFPTLQYIKERKTNWILFYRANTNRHAWPFWDIVLNDLGNQDLIHLNRYYFNFSKPVNESIFYPTKNISKCYDMCIGASHVHAKKGQYLTMQAAEYYNQRYNKSLTGVLPGGFIRCLHNKDILDSKLRKTHDIDVLGHVTRENLRDYYCRSRVLVHSGVGGQNDRSVLEAMACGIPVILTSPSHFSPFVSAAQSPNSVVYPNKIDIAEGIYRQLHNDDGAWEVDTVIKYYQAHNGMDEVCVPKMLNLFKWLETHDIEKPEMVNPRLIEEWKGVY